MNKIEDEGGMKMNELLMKNTTLTELDLRGENEEALTWMWMSKGELTGNEVIDGTEKASLIIWLNQHFPTSTPSLWNTTISIISFSSLLHHHS